MQSMQAQAVANVTFRREVGKAPKGTHTIRLVLVNQEVRF